MRVSTHNKLIAKISHTWKIKVGCHITMINGIFISICMCIFINYKDTRITIRLVTIIVSKDNERNWDPPPSKSISN